MALDLEENIKANKIFLRWQYNFFRCSRVEIAAAAAPVSPRFCVSKFPVLVDVKKKAVLSSSSSGNLITCADCRNDTVSRTVVCIQNHCGYYPGPRGRVSPPPKGHYYLSFENKLPAHTLFTPFILVPSVSADPLLSLSPPVPLPILINSVRWKIFADNYGDLWALRSGSLRLHIIHY